VKFLKSELQKANIAQRDLENDLNYLKINNSQNKLNIDINRKTSKSVPSYHENQKNFGLDAQKSSLFKKFEEESPMKIKSTRERHSRKFTFSTNSRKSWDDNSIQVLKNRKSSGRKTALNGDGVCITFPHDGFSYSYNVSYGKEKSLGVKGTMKPKAVFLDPEFLTVGDSWYRENVDNATSVWL